MIGVLAKPEMALAVQEFFELFKTPWEWYIPGRAYDVIISSCDEVPEVSGKLLIVFGSTPRPIDARLEIVAGRRSQSAILSNGHASLPIYRGVVALQHNGKGAVCLTEGPEAFGLVIKSAGSTIIRLGYDLFEEVRFLLSESQPIELASIPTADIHIRMLRGWILGADICVLEIPPVPVGAEFIACLTHDIDFVGIRNHKLDHSMWGFVYRATIGGIYNVVRGRLSFARLMRSWRAVLSVPLVHLGWAKDFWEPFEWYLEAEKGLPSTYFLIPFKRRPGDKVPGLHGARRATAYDVSDLKQWVPALRAEGCELGVHGIDAWHCAEKGRDELGRVASLTGCEISGIRMHWLLQDANTPATLERAGYGYDSTIGYNETVGYRSGTGQVFRPLGAVTLLELPMHIQDGALFYPKRLDLTEQEAEKRCEILIENARGFGGVLTLLWHDRSHAPERFWGDFYVRLIQKLKSHGCWFGSASQVVGWFRKRRQVRFEVGEMGGVSLIRIHSEGGESQPALRVRVYEPQSLHRAGQVRDEPHLSYVDLPWTGECPYELRLGQCSRASSSIPDAALGTAR
jgi:peptidoglycan/xylan/chitin deacetylase (PgdA/CDA1 family)